MEPAIRAAVSLPIINAMINRAPFAPLPNSTLNQKYNILNGIGDGAFEYPTIGYYCIGLGDMEVRVGPSGVPKTTPKLHEATDAAPFRQRPLVLRPLAEDLTDAERALHALRRRETHKGNDYWAYYARRIPEATLSPTTEYYTITDGVATAPIPWNPVTSDFDPSGRVFSSTGVNIINNEFIKSAVIRTIEWGEWERDELLNVSRILVDSEEEAFFNDIAIVGGIDKAVSVPTAGGASVMMKEVILATVFAWVYYNYDATVKDKFSFNFNSAIEEPVFSYTNPPSVIANGI